MFSTLFPRVSHYFGSDMSMWKRDEVVEEYRPPDDDDDDGERQMECKIGNEREWEVILLPVPDQHVDSVSS